ncbi:MAG TPA: DUF4402 domain-containing protein [Sphingomicrobium sp.]|nr:DUF4402 domain-containing protein [Sphingomicrobium sp.]
MSDPRILALLLAASSATAVLAWPAGAQCRLCDTPTTSRNDSAAGGEVTLEIQNGLNFDRLVLIGSGAGAAELRPDGSSFAQGAVGNVSPRAMVGTAVVRGQPGRAVRINLPRRIELHAVGGGGRMTLDDVFSDLPSLPRLDASGTLTFRFGGRLTVSGDADGQFRGDLPITVEYL